MKKPKLKNLRLNIPVSKQIHSSMLKRKSVKITINIDAEILRKLKSEAEKSGVPYQRLINRTLKESSLHSLESNTNLRLEKLEKDIQLIKKKLIA